MLSSRTNPARPFSVFVAPLLLGAAMLAASPVLHAQTRDQSALPAKPVQQVNVNEADAVTIADVLQGVGQSRAKAIVEYREQNGPFENIDELKEVKGIGEATLNQNRERILLE